MEPGKLYGNALAEFRQLAKHMDPEGKFCIEMSEQKGVERKSKKIQEVAIRSGDPSS